MSYRSGISGGAELEGTRVVGVRVNALGSRGEGRGAEGQRGNMVGPEWSPAASLISMGIAGSPAALEATIRDLRKKKTKQKRKHKNRSQKCNA